MSRTADKTIYIVHQGYLKKLSPRKFMSIDFWQTRFFVLEKTALYYYKSDRERSLGNEPTGMVPIQDIKGVALSTAKDHEGLKFEVEVCSLCNNYSRMLKCTLYSLSLVVLLTAHICYVICLPSDRLCRSLLALVR